MSKTSTKLMDIRASMVRKREELEELRKLELKLIAKRIDLLLYQNLQNLPFVTNKMLYRDICNGGAQIEKKDFDAYIRSLKDDDRYRVAEYKTKEGRHKKIFGVPDFNYFTGKWENLE